MLRDIPQPPAPAPPWGLIWPPPQKFHRVSPGNLALAANFRIDSNASSPRLDRAITRYRALIHQNSTTKDGHIGRLEVRVGSSSEMLHTATDYSYSLSIGDGDTVLSRGQVRATITAATIYGAIYGLETFSQLVSPQGFINGTAVTVEDWPTFPHRSFMVDTGRRFWPVATVKTLLDAMAMVKMNVLHLHISDNCRFAIDLPGFPRLTANLTGIMAGSYSPDDVREMVAYAEDRGIRVIPEADMPGHAQGMKGLDGYGLEFCSEKGTAAHAEIRNAGSSIPTLQAIYREIAALFPHAEELFIGADETAASGGCTVHTDYAPIEAAVSAEIVDGLNRTVGGWEEFAFETAVAKPTTDYVVNTWHYHTQFESTARGYQTVASNDSHFYLVYDQPASAYWVDIASGMNASQRALLRGGSVSAWGDEFCYIAYCIHPDKKPAAHALFPPSADALFHQSILGLSFPRAAVGAGSFWNHVPELDSSSAEFGRSLAAMGERLISRGVPACPTECHCNAASRCGVPYTPEKDGSTVASVSVTELSQLAGSRLHPPLVVSVVDDLP